MISIITKELDLFKTQLAEKNVTLDITETCVNHLAEEGYSKEFGARNAGRLVEEKIKTFFVDEVLFGALCEGGAARADYVDGDYVISVTESAAPADSAHSEALASVDGENTSLVTAEAE